MVSRIPNVLLKNPPRSGPATAEEAQVTCIVRVKNGTMDTENKLTLRAWLQ